MVNYCVIVEKCPDTGMFVGHVPSFEGAHAQGETLDVLRCNMQEVLAMLQESGLSPSSEFVGVINVNIA